MNPMVSRKSRWVALGFLGLLALGSVLMANRRVAQADAPGAPGSLDPRLWAQNDYRIPTKKDLIKAAIRFELICGANASQMASGLGLQAANVPSLPGHLALAVSCALGAPQGATCDELAQCTGQSSAPPSLTRSQCDGGLLRYTHRTPQGEDMVVGTSCRAQGEQCFQGKLGALCGVGVCSPEEPYACDGDVIVSCIQGIKVRTPCGRGMTCGESPGNRSINCIGKGDACTGEGRCVGNILYRCQKDAWGQGREQPVDCSDFGLTCHSFQDEQGRLQGRCIPPAPASCTVGKPLSCKGTDLAICVQGVEESIPCAEVGGSACVQPPGAKATCGNSGS